MRPSFGFQSELITAEVHSVGENLGFPRGIWQGAEVWLPYGEMFADAIKIGTAFTLNFGGWKIGEGIVEGILE
jgi:hypothetical protein